MTRAVAVIGTSNIGAVKYAEAEIAADHPDLSVTFYGLPAGKFAAAGVDEAGLFQPAPGDGAARKLAKRVNGTVALDLTAFDAVLVIGDTMGMADTLFMAAQHDVVDWSTRRHRPLISAAAFMAAIQEAVAIRTDHLARQVRGIAPVFVAQAPYPTIAATRRGPHRLEPYASVADHPELPRIHALFGDVLTDALSARGMRFVPQPQETMAGPFLTRKRYAMGAMDFRAPGRVLDDHRHMNAAFGASLFRAFALALDAPSAGADPTDRTKE